MKIAVCVKHVPEGTKRIDPATKRLDRSGEGALNSFDANAVEEALRLKDATGDGELMVKRQTEFGYDVIEASLPAVVAVSDAINEPRYPSLKGIMGAKSKPQETVALADLGVEPERAGQRGSRTEVVALNEPPPRGDSRKIEDDGSAAHAVVDFLAEKRLI